MTENMQDRLVAAYQIASKGEYDHARMILEETLYDDSKNMDAWMLLADLAENKDEAIQCYQMVLELDPQSWIARQRLKLLFGQQQAAVEVEDSLFSEEVAEEFPLFDDFLPEEEKRFEGKVDGPTLKESFAAHRKLVIGVVAGIAAVLVLGALAWLGSLVYFAWRMGFLIFTG